MGLPLEFHERCRMSLEIDYLKIFYYWTRDAASSVTYKIVESAAVPEVKVCTAALRLMLQILNWDFRYRTGGLKARVNVFSSGVRPDNSSPKRSDCPLVQCGPAWRDVLISSGHVGWLLNFYAALREKFSCEGYWIDCSIAVSARKLIVQFCSLTGAIFPDDGQMQQHHLLQLLAAVVQLIDPPDVVSNAIQNGRSERPFGTLTLLPTLMCEVVMTNDTDEEKCNTLSVINTIANHIHDVNLPLYSFVCLHFISNDSFLSFMILLFAFCLVFD